MAVFFSFYIHVKAVNKAQQETVVTLGPVVVDLSPPVYTSGLEVRELDDEVVITWPATAFVDYQDPGLVVEYMIAVGKCDIQII